MFMPDNSPLSMQMFMPDNSPLSRISKQMRKQDCMISHTDSLVSSTPAGHSNSVLSTCQQSLMLEPKSIPDLDFKHN